MRVLVASNTYPPADISGVASLVYELAHALGGEGEGGDHVDVLTRASAADDPYAVAVGGSKSTYPLRAGLRYARLALASPYDLVHVHESDGFFVVLVHRLARALGLRAGRGVLLATLQVSYDRERREIRVLRDRAARGGAGRVLSRPTDDERRFARWKTRVHGLFGRVMVRLCDRVVAPSWRTKTELEDDYGARDVAVIENGLALDSVAVARRTALEDDRRRVDGDGPSRPGPIVLYAGRLRTRKAVAVLLAAWKRVLAAHPSARLWIVGDGPQEAALRAQARDAGLTGSDDADDPSDERAAVRFWGRLDREDLLALYGRVDLYCLPSTYEGFPVAILEAMASGLPVVSTTVSGIPEAVVDGETGLLVPPVDVGALAEALSRLLGDSALRRRMGAAGRRRVEERFTIEAIVERHLEVWRDALEGETLCQSVPRPTSEPTRRGPR